MESSQIPVVLGTEESVTAVPGEEGGVLVEKGQKASVNLQQELLENITAPVSKGQRLGTLYVKAGEQVLKEIPLVAETAVPRLTFGQIFRKVLQKVTFN